MRIAFTITAILSFNLFIHAQNAVAQNAVDGMGDDFKQIVKLGARGAGFEGLQTYSSGVVNGSQFFAPSWVSGTVSTTGNQTFGKGYVFIYDKVRQELFIKTKDSSAILQGDKDQIISFTLNTDRTHYFIASAHYVSAPKGIFYEQLVNSEKGYSLLKLIKCKFEKADPRDIEKQRLGEVYDAFVDDISYYISYNGGALQPVALKEKSIRKVLEPAKNKVDNFIKGQGDYTVDEPFLTRLVEFINQ